MRVWRPDRLIGPPRPRKWRTNNCRIANEQQRLAKEQAQLAKKQRRLAEEAAEREVKLRTEAEQQRNLAKKATKEAEAARKQAVAVTNYLVEAFRSPDPEREGRSHHRGGSAGQGGRALDKEFENDLPLKARLHQALGEAYQVLGLPKDAVNQLQKVYEIDRQTLGKDKEVTLQAMVDLAWVYLDAGRHADALRLLEEAITVLSDVFGRERKLTFEKHSWYLRVHTVNTALPWTASERKMPEWTT